MTVNSISSLHLDAFFAVAQTRNFSKAAEKLHVTQSALSQRILNLESELEATLFIRDRSGVQLTEPGEELLRYCQSRSALEQEFLSTLKSKTGLLGGEVRIGGFSSIMRSVILPALAPLLRENPDIRLNLLTRELRELPDMMKRGEIDFMVLDQKLDKEGLKAIELGFEENVLVQAKGLDVPEVYLDHDEQDEVTRRYLKLAGKSLKSFQRRYLDDVYGLLDGARLGVGRAVLPRHLIQEIKDLRIMNAGTVLRIPIVLHMHDQPYYPKLHQAVMKALSKNCAKILG
jgi:DNA-binding transcriptional LysR family regulator